MSEEERAFNAAIRVAARRGKVVVVGERVTDTATGKFVAGSDMNLLIRQKAGRSSIQPQTPAETTKPMPNDRRVDTPGMHN